MKKILLINAIFVSISIPINLTAQEWLLREPMPTARYFPSATLAGTAQNSLIYVLGGVSAAETIINDNEVYDISEDSWKVLKPMPTHRMEFFATTVGKKIYAIGGFNYESTALNVVEIYDPETDSWSEGTPMPTSRSQITGAVIGNKIYLTGGWPSSFATLEIYDPIADTWTTGSSAPVGIHHYNNGVAFENKIYTFGGANYGGSFSYDNTYCYNPVSNTWIEKTEMPEGRYAGGAAVYQNKIHYFGGSSELGRYYTYDNHYIYDPVTDSWTDGIDMEENRGNMVAVTAPDGIYVIGGYVRCEDCDNVTDLNKRYSEEEPSSAKNIKAPLDMLLYPNPATNEIKVSVKEDNLVKHISFADITGKILKTMVTYDSNVTINTADMAMGIYVLTVQTSKGVSTQKISITH